ncbi:MAG: HIT family protein [Patescibacteria group bacterium]|nr:HIT family protein [Patescibacteria group bacterium]MDE1945922.1 HIT family protein [Patescibacteria group bacterium]
MENCIFCKLVQEGATLKVWESENYLGFLDIYPVMPGHTLLIPKKHEDYVFDLPDAEYTALFLEAKKLAKKLKEKIGAKRIGILVEGFGVPHTHVHLIPINKPREISGPSKEADMAELEKLAKKING